MTNTSSIILAADVGGTKTNIALFDVRRAGALSANVVFSASLSSGAHSGLGDLVESFLGQARGVVRTQPRAACFGLPGPVANGTCATSNLPWRVEASELRRRFDVPNVSLLNDLEATAYAVSALGEGELRRLSPASRPEAGRPRAVIAAGTGLGMAIMTSEPDGFRPSASEGGHVEFAPQDELEIDLLRYLKRDLEHVSIERLVSGPGLARLYDFFSDRGGLVKNEALAAQVRAAPESAPAAVARAALASECPVATAALDLFVKQYGAVAGNLALTAYATGGLYLAGGIAPKILKKLEDGAFMQSFTAKGRLRPLTERVPVFVLLNEQAPLFGAAHFAKLALARS